MIARRLIRLAGQEPAKAEKEKQHNKPFSFTADLSKEAPAGTSFMESPKKAAK